MARGELTGKKPSIQSSGEDQLPHGMSAKLAYSINEFCMLHGISRAHYYNLKRFGLGPREMDLRGRKAISVESAAAWRRAREAGNVM
jgi:hypothetical protein